jgi:hypothetical protein
LEHWQDWQARSQVQQSFCTPGHTKRCATSFTVALVPGCEILSTDWKTWSRWEPGTSYPSSLNLPVEALHYPVNRGVVGGRQRELNAAHPCQGLENLGFELTSLVGGDGLGATDSGYAAGQLSASHGVG